MMNGFNYALISNLSILEKLPRHIPICTVARARKRIVYQYMELLMALGLNLTFTLLELLLQRFWHLKQRKILFSFEM